MRKILLTVSGMSYACAIMLLVVTSVISIHRTAEALCITNTYAVVEMNNLQIGKTYNLSQITRFPLSSANRDSGTIGLMFTVEYPSAGDSLRTGYEPIPDVSWVTIPQSRFSNVGFGSSAILDVLLTIPDDKQYLGKKYQFYLSSYSVTGDPIGVGVSGKILISISDAEPDHAEKNAVKPENVPGTKIKSSPYILEAKDVPLGQKYSIGKLKIANDNNCDVECKPESLKLQPTLVYRRPSYCNPMHPEFLLFEPDHIVIPAKKEAEIELFTNFPKEFEDPVLAPCQGFIFIVRIQVPQPGVDSGLGIYNIVYVRMREKEKVGAEINFK